LAGIATSYSKLGRWPESLKQKIPVMATEFVERQIYSPWNFDSFRLISRFCWAFAKSEIECNGYLRAVEKSVILAHKKEVPNDKKPLNWLAFTDARQLSTIAWAYSKLNYRSETLFSELAKCSFRVITNFSPLGISLFLAAYAKFGIVTPSWLFPRFFTQIRKKLNQFSATQLSLLIWSIAQYELARINQEDLRKENLKIPTRRLVQSSSWELLIDLDKEVSEKKGDLREIDYKTMKEAFEKIGYIAKYLKFNEQQGKKE